MRPSERLRAAASAEWASMQSCRFVQDIEADRLPRPVYARYLHFERDFVEIAMTIFGHAMLKAPTLAARRRLCAILHGLAGPQLDYFDASLAALAPQSPPPVLPPAVDRFFRSTRAVAESAAYPVILAMMLAAEWTYATWCVRAHASPASDRLIADWVRLHAEPEFLEQVDWLQAQIDSALTAEPSLEGPAREIFARMLALEIDFHDAAYPEHAG